MGGFKVFKMLSLLLMIMVFLSSFLAALLAAPVGVYAYNSSSGSLQYYSEAVAKQLSSLEQMGDEIVNVIVMLQPDISQDQLSRIVSQLNSTTFSFHGVTVPILFGRPVKLENGYYVLRLIGPSKLLADRLSG
ncbi:MAG: hypothetical protein QXW41_09520, partial [Fervidicoccaceae archaeon]